MLTRLYGIAVTTFLETIRQPIYGVILLVTGLLMILNVTLAAYTLKDDNRLLLDAGLSTLLLAGLFLAAFSASGVLNREIENKTVMVVLAKPVSRPLFLLGKMLGLFAALTVAYYLMFLLFAMAQRHAVLQNSADPWDFPVMVFGGGGTLLVLLAAAFCNYFYGWEFSSAALAFAVPTLTGAMGLIAMFGKKFALVPFWTDMIGGQVVIAGILVFLAILVLAALALAASTRVGQVMTLLICVGALMLGLVADYMVGELSQQTLWADIIYRTVPNLGLFFVVDALISSEITIPIDYLFRVSLYAFLLICALLSVAVALFQTREVG